MCAHTAIRMRSPALFLLRTVLLCPIVAFVDGFTPSAIDIARISLLKVRSFRPSLVSVTARSDRTEPPPDFTIEHDDNGDEEPLGVSTKISSKVLSDESVDSDGWRRKTTTRATVSGRANFGDSWMQRNSKFSSEEEELNSMIPPPRKGSSRSEQSRGSDSNKSFRQDFRGTRVFVQGLPPDCNWQTLKDHFKIAGNVVFASVSTDTETGRSKGCGIVQYETTNEAVHAIRMMRSFPLNNYELFVREDVQDTGTDEPWSKHQQSSVKGPTPPSKWKCANDEDAKGRLGDDTIKTIQQLLKARDQARRRRNYDASDAMREELRQTHNVQLDDRLTLWWVGTAAPVMIQDIKGDGRWDDRTTEWRQIPTTPEYDACVNPDLVQGLLKQRDIARREKDFATSDSLLEQARQAPDGDLYLRIHDESRTWRIWTDEAPKRPVRHESHDEAQMASPADQCIAICTEYAPEKLDEVRLLLTKFPGREYNILKKLKQRYVS